MKDRVVQSAAAIVLQPIWEADFHDHSYAYRPKRRTHQAMDKVKEALLNGKVEVVDADLSSYFDLIPHRQLLRQVAKRVSDGSMLRLIKAWLRASIVEEDRDTGRRKVLPNRCGTPQGGVMTPWTHLVILSIGLLLRIRARRGRCDRPGGQGNRWRALIIPAAVRQWDAMVHGDRVVFDNHVFHQ